MDFLSIASGVAGLISVTGKIIVTLTTLSRGLSDAPSAVGRVITEMEILRFVIEEINDAVLNEEQQSSQISMRSLVYTITNCVKLVSELERHVDEVGGNEFVKDSTIGGKAKWVWKEKEVMSLISEIERHKLSLNIIISCVNWYAC